MSTAAESRGARPGLTDEQEPAAARRSEPLLLSAAAGSGKTSVLVERFVRAVCEDGIAPARILAITFTDRAAGELRERVRARLLELGERDAARDTEAAFVSTFHGFCSRLLRAHPLLAGLDPEFTVLDEGLAGRLRRAAMRRALARFLEGERGEAVDLIAAYKAERIGTMIEGVHARLRSQGQLLPRLPRALIAADAEEPEREAAAACGLLDELLRGFGAAYEELKRARGALDFDDLELRARALLEQREGVRAAWSERFELLMVDEFQDTNPRQLGILRALERENLFTVGDEHQSIYGFRHADVSLFRERRSDLAARGASLALTRNFRSRAPLLEIVNAVFLERLPGFAALLPARPAPPVKSASAQPTLWEEPQEEQPEALVELLLTARTGWEQDEPLAERIAGGLPHTQLWRAAEARVLAQRVAELVASGRARAGEVVVLLRSGGDLEVYERALQLCGLRTLAAAGGFWAHQQIGDLLAYLRTLANPLDEEALYSLLASPLLGLSRDGLALTARAARTARKGVWATIAGAEGPELLAGIPVQERRELLAFAEWLGGERRGASQRTIAEVLDRAIAARGYREHVLGLEWGERRLANVHKLLRLARRFEAGEGRDLRGFLDHVEHLQDPAGSRESDAPVAGVEPDAVRLMTIHAAKGLEFPVVCVADLGRAPHTGVPDLLVEGGRIGLRLARLDGEPTTPALEYDALCEELKSREAEEEDRILYVAMTRARERLLLSGAIDFERWPAPRAGGTPISWLAPGLAAEIPDLALAAPERAEHELAIGPGGAPVKLTLNSPATVGEVLRPASIRGGVPEPHDVAPARGGLGTEDLRYTEEPGGREFALEAAPPGEPASQPVRLPLPAPAAERISTFSYTSLSELERCGYRYYLERVLGLSEDASAVRSAPDGGALEARARGTLVHALLERLDFSRPRAPLEGDVRALARELEMRVSREQAAEIATLIEGALGGATAARVAEATAIRREYPFAFSLGAEQPLITGVIDLLAEEPGGRYLVIDYKSDRVGAGVDLDAVVERDYAVQRLLYGLAALRDGAASVEIVHWFLERPHEPVQARYEATDRAELERALEMRVAAADANGFRVSSRPHRGLCQSCPGRTSLCSWGEAETMREDPPLDTPVASSS